MIVTSGESGQETRGAYGGQSHSRGHQGGHKIGKCSEYCQERVRGGQEDKDEGKEGLQEAFKYEG